MDLSIRRNNFDLQNTIASEDQWPSPKNSPGRNGSEAEVIEEVLQITNFSEELPSWAVGSMFTKARVGLA
jgi:hypothetical protein